MGFARKIYYLLHPKWRLIVRRVFYAPIDLLQQITNMGHTHLIPPKGLIYTGAGDFVQIGNHFVNLLKTYCHLQPHHAVLDIGCGIGRIALPLTHYLSDNGRYFGFDIVKTGIQWCKDNISKRYKNFEFLHVELQNDLYTGKVPQKASEFGFPIENQTFDIIVATSVFTHMMPEDMEHYLSETARVMKADARCLFTFFILNETSQKHMASRDVFNFKHHYEHYSLMHDKVKEANVAYQEWYLNELFGKYGFKIEKLITGHWFTEKIEGNLDFQDIVILSKT